MKRPLIIVILTVAVLAGLFLMLKPRPAPHAYQSAQTKIFTLAVKDRKLTSGPDALKVNQGDKVTINITCNEDEELHLHGYNKMVDLTKDKPAELSFTADTSGNFPYELEHSKTDIGSLQVQPK